MNHYRYFPVLISVVYFEVGLFLILFPWMDLWEHNLVISYFPFLREFFVNYFLRGAVTGLGLANVFLGILEIGQFFKANRTR